MKTSEPAICLMFSKNKYIPDAPVLMRVSFYPVNILCSAHDSHRSYNRHVFAAAGRFNVAHKIEHTPTAFVMRQSQHVRSNYAVISLFHFNRIRWCSGIKLIALLCGHSIVWLRCGDTERVTEWRSHSGITLLTLALPTLRMMMKRNGKLNNGKVETNLPCCPVFLRFGYIPLMFIGFWLKKAHTKTVLLSKIASHHHGRKQWTRQSLQALFIILHIGKVAFRCLSVFGPLSIPHTPDWNERAPFVFVNHPNIWYSLWKWTIWCICSMRALDML